MSFPTAHTPWRTRALGALALALLASLAATRADAAPTAVMVLYFDNDTGNADYDSLTKGLADMMITDLSAVPSLAVVERQKLEAILHELKLQRTKYFDPKTAQRIGRGTGAAYAVTGSMISIDPNIRLDVRMIRVDSAVVVKSATVTGNKARFFDLQQELTAKLVDGLSGALAAGDAGKAAAATRANRLDDLKVALDYSRGLEASDRGDLTAASGHFQKVVTASPNFQLGKDRYRQAMKALYEAKGRRESLLSGSERELVAHLDAETAAGAAKGNRAIAYRVLRGQYYLTRLAQAIEKNQPPGTYKDLLRAHVDNQLKLFDETQGMLEYAVGVDVGRFSQDDERLANEVGIKMPGNTFAFTYHPYNVLRELGHLLVDNEPSIHQVSMSARGLPCFFRMDPSYPKLVLDAYDKAAANIRKNEAKLHGYEPMRTAREHAHALAVFGRPEEAIAKLQATLERYPKAEEFKDVESDLRDILAGDIRTSCQAR